LVDSFLQIVEGYNLSEPGGGEELEVFFDRPETRNFGTPKSLHDDTRR
jgi:hypothetical protein